MEELYVFAIAWFIGGFMAGLTGLGGAMIALPLTISYLAPTMIVPITICAVTVLSLAMFFLYKSHINTQAVVTLSVGSIPGSMLGMYILLYISAQKIQIFAGSIMLLFVVWQLLPKKHIVYQDSRTKGLVAGFVSGFLNTSVSFSGPPIAIYAICVDWAKETFFATISFATFLICIITMAIYAYSGLYTMEMLPYIATILPAVVVGVLMAYPLSKKINKDFFRKLVLLVILVAGTICMYRGISIYF